ncbi:hypothetical protein SNL152K_4765 [Streptomyces sp. NL15-2K]|nr:hypothetical protein SNL152K_4765 [Streptomyces sp. NL15-2K]
MSSPPSVPAASLTVIIVTGNQVSDSSRPGSLVRVARHHKYLRGSALRVRFSSPAPA